jgi:hypothetical protein
MSFLDFLAPIAKIAAPIANFIPGIGPIISGVLGGIGGAAGASDGGGGGGGASSSPQYQAMWQPGADALKKGFQYSDDYIQKYGGLNSKENEIRGKGYGQYNGGMMSQIPDQYKTNADQLSTSGFGAARTYLNQGINKAGIDQDVMGYAMNNPYVDQNIANMANDVNRNLDRNILPSLRNNASNNGLIGSSRAGIAEGLAGSDAARIISDNATKYRGDLYGTALKMGGDFGKSNADAANERQKDQANLGMNMGDKGMGYLGNAYDYSGKNISGEMGLAGMDRNIAGDALSKYQTGMNGAGQVLSNPGAPVPLTKEQKQANLWGGIAGGIGQGIDQYNNMQKNNQQQTLNDLEYQKKINDYKKQGIVPNAT